MKEINGEAPGNKAPLLMKKKLIDFGSIDPITMLVAILTVALWGSAFVGIRVGLKSYSPESLALLRYLVSSLLLAIYAFAIKMPLPRLADLPGLAGLGFVGLTVYNLLVNTGEQTTQAGQASLIVASAPIFTALLAILFLKERLTRIAWVGLGVCLVGVALICLKNDHELYFSSGSILLFLGAIASAGYSVGQKNYLAQYTPVQVTCFAFWFGTLFLLIFAPGLANQIPQAQPSATLAAIFLGIVPGAIGYIGWGIVFSRLPASRAGSFLFLVPVFATIIAWFWLGETLSIQSILGGALVLVGTAVIHHK